MKDFMKKLTAPKIFAVILAGVLLMIIAVPSDSLEEKLVSSDPGRNSYRTELELSLITFLSKLEGVGKTDVVLYTKSSKEGYFSSEQEETIVGVLVSCEGADSYVVQSEIIESISALFGISTNKIRVLKSDFQE